MESFDPTESYQQTRNSLDGDVSRLSPYITHGVLPLRKVFTYYFENYQLTDAYKFLQELVWREFFQRVWWNHGDDIFADMRRAQPEANREGIPKALVNANTGIDAIDKQITNLYESGYVHNHARMWIASLACNLAEFSWWQPSVWFYYHLLDGDPAANMLNWQWVAGSMSYNLYWFNQGNVNKYAPNTQHDTWVDTSYENIKNGDFNTPKNMTESADMNLKTDLPNTKKPDIDTSKPIYLYHNFHLDPQWRQDTDANRILVLEPEHFQSLPVSDRVLQFILDLAGNIADIQVHVGTPDDLPLDDVPKVRTKAHQTYQHWPGTKDKRDIIFRSVADEDVGLVFTPYWKNYCYPRLKKLANNK
jgi:deoxyribodipyrimidine photo-lyase